jgi:hypothetical protein
LDAGQLSARVFRYCRHPKTGTCPDIALELADKGAFGVQFLLIVVDHSRMRMLRQLLVSTPLDYMTMAHDNAVEVPLQNPLDGLPCCSPISDASEPDKPVRSEVSDIPETIE